MSASWFTVTQSTFEYLFTLLKGVFDTKADSSHTHTKSEITDFAHDHPLSIEAASTSTSAINLDPNAIYKLTAGGKTFIFKTPADSDHYAWSDITGKPSTFPPSSHTHTKSEITDFPSTMPPSSHTHGNIQNGGTLQTNDVAIANGDKLVITDSSDSSKIARASIAFDGSTATKCLTQKGTWENFTNNAGTITGIKMNGSTVGTSGVVDLGTVITSHQDISGKLNKTGGTMTGQLTISESTTDVPLYLDAKSGSSGCYVGFRIGGTGKGYFYLDGTDAGVYFTSKKPLAYRSEIPTSLPASDVYAWAKAANKPSYTLDEVSDGSTRKLANYLPLVCQLGIKGCSGGGNYRYFKIATLTISYKYVNGPVAFEISQRQFALSLIQVSFASEANSDPTLSYFITDSERGYWIIKTATSTWDLYGIYNEVWGAASLHRIVGYRVNNGVNVTVKMENVSSLPDGATQAVYGGAANYANSAGAVAWSNVSDKPSSFTPSSHTHGNIQNGGTLQTNDITIASGDKLVVTDSSDSSKIARASISFDGSTATKCLTQKGTWETFASSNTDSNVAQTATTTNSYYEVLFSGTADNTTRTEGARKTNTLRYNPNSKIFNVSGSVKAEVVNVFNTVKLNTTTDTWAFNVTDYNEATVFGVHFNNNIAIAQLGNGYDVGSYMAQGVMRLYSKQSYYADLKTADTTYTANRTFTLPDANGQINVYAGEALDSATTEWRVMFGYTDGRTLTHQRLRYKPSSGNLYVNNSSDKRCWSIWDNDIDSTATQQTTLALGNEDSSKGARTGRLVLYSTTNIASQLTAHTDGTLCANGYGVIVSHDMNNWHVSQIIPAGDSSSSYLHCNTSNGAYGINWWLSDTKLKENIEDTEVTALDKVDKIDFIQFDWKKDDKHVDLGVSANQIEEFMPDAVWNIKQPEDYEYDTIKNIDTGKMTTYALKAIQELHKIVEDQAKEIADLKAKLP